MNKKVTLIALEPIRHDGKRYAKGDSVSVTEAQAAQLLAVGAASVPLVERKPSGRKGVGSGSSTPQDDGGTDPAGGGEGGADGSGSGGE